MVVWQAGRKRTGHGWGRVGGWEAAWLADEMIDLLFHMKSGGVFSVVAFLPTMPLFPPPICLCAFLLPATLLLCENPQQWGDGRRACWREIEERPI